MSFAPSASVVMAEFARFCANSAIATFALVAKLCEFHICNIFAPNSIFRPVYSLQRAADSEYKNTTKLLMFIILVTLPLCSNEIICI